jgi:hypothetical protein
MAAARTSLAGSSEELELEEGQVLRVLSLIDVSSALVEFRNGTTGRITGVANTNLSVGDVFFVSAGTWCPCPLNPGRREIAQEPLPGLMTTR